MEIDEIIHTLSRPLWTMRNAPFGKGRTEGKGRKTYAPGLHKRHRARKDCTGKPRSLPSYLPSFPQGKPQRPQLVYDDERGVK